jgi:hypothetical protein
VSDASRGDDDCDGAPLLLEVLDACEPADLGALLRKCRLHQAADADGSALNGVLCVRIIDDALAAVAVSKGIRVIAY